ncbi:MAG: cytochrome P450 [Litorimonas sp.]
MSGFTFNPTSNSFTANPYAVYAQLRAQDAPFYWPDLDMVMLSRFEDVSQVALNSSCVRSLQNHRSSEDLLAEKEKSGFDNMPYHERFVQKNLLDTDGPEHIRLRKLVFGAFTTRAVQRLENEILGYVRTLFRSLPQKTTFDFITHISSHLPGMVIARFLGVPISDATQLGAWSEKVVAYYDVDKTPEKKAAAEDAVKAFHDYLVTLKSERVHEPTDDLISKMVAQKAEGLFQSDELIATSMLILMAGHGSSIDVIGTGLLALLNNPEAMTSLRENPSLWPSAIEEMFRYEPPLPFFHRHATNEVNIRGHNYPAGTTFGLLYAAANRDEAVFSKPEKFDIFRQPNRHMAFGRGAHLCLGNQLAKLNMKVLFTYLFSEYEAVELDGLPEFKTGLSIRGLKTLPVKLS